MKRRGFFKLLGLVAGAAAAAKLGAVQPSTEPLTGGVMPPEGNHRWGYVPNIIYTSDDGITWTMSYENTLVDSEEKLHEAVNAYFEAHRNKLGGLA